MGLEDHRAPADAADRVGLAHFALENLRLGFTAARRGLDYTRGLEYPLAYNAARLEPARRLRVADLGSGESALLSRVIARRTAALVIAVDPLLGRRPGRRVLALRADAVRLPLRSGSLDRILLVSTIEHLEGEGDARAMAEVGRVLAPGGTCVLTTPYDAGGAREEFRPGPVYGRGRAGEPTFFERSYDERSLAERLIEPSRLRERERRYFGEPGFSFERFRDRCLRGGLVARLLNLPFALAMPLISRRFFRDLGPHPPGAGAGKAAGKGGGVMLALQKPLPEADGDPERAGSS